MIDPSLVGVVGIESAGALATLLGKQLTVPVTHWFKRRLKTVGTQTRQLSWAVGLVLTNLFSLSFGVYGELSVKTAIVVVVSTLVAVLGAQGSHEHRLDLTEGPAKAASDAPA